MTTETSQSSKDPFADPANSDHVTIGASGPAELYVGRGARLLLAEDSLIVHGIRRPSLLMTSLF